MGFFRCGRLQFLAKKKLMFFRNFIVCPYVQRERGLSQCGHFSDKVGGANFSRFCADVLYGQSLTAAECCDGCYMEGVVTTC